MKINTIEFIQRSENGGAPLDNETAHNEKIGHGTPLILMPTRQFVALLKRAVEAVRTVGVDYGFVDELEELGRSPGFLRPCQEDYDVMGKPMPEYSPEEFDRENHNVRTREIGKKLEELGGYRLMQAACSRIHSRLHKEFPYASRCLEFAWNGIGQWLA